MNLVDSSGWLEYFADGEHAGFFAPAIEKIAELIVPTICILEVFKRVVQQRDENAGLQAVALMQQGRLIDLTSTLALSAAKFGIELRLPLADSIILATARAYGAVVWTQDSDFEGIPMVRYIQKKRK